MFDFPEQLTEMFSFEAVIYRRGAAREKFASVSRLRGENRWKFFSASSSFDKLTVSDSLISKQMWNEWERFFFQNQICRKLDRASRAFQLKYSIHFHSDLHHQQRSNFARENRTSWSKATFLCQQSNFSDFFVTDSSDKKREYLQSNGNKKLIFLLDHFSFASNEGLGRRRSSLLYSTFLSED